MQILNQKTNKTSDRLEKDQQNQYSLSLNNLQKVNCYHLSSKL